METCMFLCFYVGIKVTCFLYKSYMQAQNMRVFMYFLHLVPTVSPNDIIAEKGLLH